ncbi:acyl-ACP thioesterase domain-containing protein [Clostridium sp. 1001271B_151109_B4]|uniref:acyl-[acyl-carrier-protein] thioesterase n=1 Tax=Clostridium sp. 1001271B_151109_B4 TaxID=2787148 RepID=UPI0018A9335E|nr:acyl-ACP thioesterase domain-containing protein [Clostridium sp. 1001271B_151109_B4]
MGIKTEKEYEIHYYEVNYKLDCKMSSIINYFCDIGTVQSEGLGVGIDYLTERRLAWVFYRYDISVKRYPKFGEKIKVITKAKSFKKFYASRAYEIYDENNEKIVDGEGIFLLINIDKRRAVRIPDDQYVAYGVDLNEKSDIKIERLEKVQQSTNKEFFKVRYGDIDSNMHVNNVKYVEWAVESLPLEIVLNYELRDLSVVFEKECKYGSEIIASYELREDELREENDELIILHKIENAEGTELSILKSKWIKLKN